MVKKKFGNTNLNSDSHSSSDTHSIGESNQSDYIGDTSSTKESIPFSCLYDTTPSTDTYPTLYKERSIKENIPTLHSNQSLNS